MSKKCKNPVTYKLIRKYMQHINVKCNFNVLYFQTSIVPQLKSSGATILLR